MSTIKQGDKVQHTIARKTGVVHLVCPDKRFVLVRYGRDTRPTQVPVEDLRKIG